MPIDTTTRKGTIPQHPQSHNQTVSPTSDNPDASITHPLSSQESPEADYEIDNTRFALHLLIILCLGALASFSLAPYFLAQIPSMH